MKLSELSRSQKAELLTLLNLGYKLYIQEAKKQEKDIEAFVKLAHHMAYSELVQTGLSDEDAEYKLSEESLNWEVKLVRYGTQFDKQLKELLSDL